MDISASGVSARFVFDKTYPNGFTGNDWASDADPVDLPSQVIAAVEMNVNGQLVSWSSPTPLPLTINVIPGSPTDIDLSYAMEANRPAAGKRIALDMVTIVFTYPDGGTVTLSNGKLLQGAPGRSVATAGRFKAKQYQFAFQDFASTRGR